MQDARRRSGGRFGALLLRARTVAALVSARRSTRLALNRRVHRLLVVCYGNIYRSALLGTLLAQRGVGRWETRSAGFHAVAGRPCPKRLVDLCTSLGIDLSGHRSACIAADDVNWADLIVVMDRHNWHALAKLGAAADKIAWAGAMTPGPLEIPDPYDVPNRDLEAVVRRLIEVEERLSSELSPAARCEAMQ